MTWHVVACRPARRSEWRRAGCGSGVAELAERRLCSVGSVEGQVEDELRLRAGRRSHAVHVRLIWERELLAAIASSGKSVRLIGP